MSTLKAEKGCLCGTKRCYQLRSRCGLYGGKGKNSTVGKLFTPTHWPPLHAALQKSIRKASAQRSWMRNVRCRASRIPYAFIFISVPLKFRPFAYFPCVGTARIWAFTMKAFDSLQRHLLTQLYPICIFLNTVANCRQNKLNKSCNFLLPTMLINTFPIYTKNTFVKKPIW